MEYISLNTSEVIDIDVPVEVRGSDVDDQSVADMSSRTRGRQREARRRCRRAFHDGLQESHRLAIGPDPKADIEDEFPDPGDFVDGVAKTLYVVLSPGKS